MDMIGMIRRLHSRKNKSAGTVAQIECVWRWRATLKRPSFHLSKVELRRVKTRPQ